jgi:hypothetical protein
MCYRGETPSAPSVTTGSCLEYTFSGGYAKNPKKHQAMGQHVNAPEEARGRMESMHDAEIAKHEKAGRVYRRRAEHAQAGYVLASPDDDADYLRSHQELHDLARRTGRLRQTGEGIG